MTTPKRLLEAEGTDIELRLLGAARDEAPSKALEARMRAGLGLPFAAPGPVSDFPPAVPAPTATTTSGAAGASAQGVSQAASQAAASQAAGSAAAAGAASAGTSAGFSWTTVLLGVALLGGFGAAAFSVASGDARDTAKSGVATARAPGEPGAPAAASPPPGATLSSTTRPSTTRPSTTLPSTASNPSTTSGSDAVATTGANALVDGSPSDGAHAANVDGTTNAGVARGVTSSGANAPSGAARGATTGAGSTATGSSASSAGATAARATALAAGAPSSTPSRETTLNEEIRLVDSMRSALAQGDGALALSRAATYRSRFPAGTLR